MLAIILSVISDFFCSGCAVTNSALGKAAKQSFFQLDGKPVRARLSPSRLCASSSTGMETQ